MPETPTTAATKSTTGRRTIEGARSGKGKATGCSRRRARAGRSARLNTQEHSYIVENGRTAYVLVPVEEYEELIKTRMVNRAIAQIESGDNDFVDADEFALELAAERIAKARKAKGLTQKQLGEKLNLPQSQISRIERNPDRTTVRTLKRIARALGVDVSSLV